jgi:hypothetical protein
MEVENIPEWKEQPATSPMLLLPAHISEVIALLPAGRMPEIKTPPEWLKYRIRGYIIGIAISTVILYLVNNLLNIYVPWIPGDFSKFFWNILNNVYNHVEISHLLKTFGQCLWAINLYLLISILGNFVLLLYRPRWFHHLIQAAMTGLAVLPVYVVYKIYPFSFDQAAINTGVKAGMIVIMAGLGIGSIYQLAMFIKAAALNLQSKPPRLNPVMPPPQEQMPDQTGM